VPGELLSRRKVCIIHGLGGIGKTQLAVEYARMHKDKYTSFFWLDGKTEESLVQSLLAIGSRIPKSQNIEDLPNIEGSEESKRKAQEVLQWFAVKGNSQWLLIFDNIDKTSYGEDTDQKDDSSYNIEGYLPSSDSGSIIITTRLPRLGDLGDSIQIHPLDFENSLLLLAKHVGRSLKQSSPENAGNVETWDPGSYLCSIKRSTRFCFYQLSLILLTLS